MFALLKTCLLLHSKVWVLQCRDVAPGKPVAQLEISELCLDAEAG